eukprot:591306-Amphidinium_carterae.1
MHCQRRKETLINWVSLCGSESALRGSSNCTGNISRAALLMLPSRVAQLPCPSMLASTQHTRIRCVKLGHQPSTLD